MTALYQAKALAVSTAVCFGLGVGGVFVSRSFSLAKDSAEVAGVHEALSLAGEQRVSSEVAQGSCHESKLCSFEWLVYPIGLIPISLAG